ncbi:tyrosine-protein kinase transmembrane receptor Ror2 [Trichonephila clavata]|uniref:Tyrosine-protein kinase transmembrane receptor Ror2 n=1 Tax=Trichonephila clavata TaxID=2740835 RepID=A0A8X6FMS1_TRICU|nr:tyrosine-protein kinase transmembrane receptor Ror2 [Trichonephila clavata]
MYFLHYLDEYALDDPVYTHSELSLNATRTTSFTCKATNSLLSLNSSLVTDSKQFQLYVTPKDGHSDAQFSRTEDGQLISCHQISCRSMIREKSNTRISAHPTTTGLNKVQHKNCLTTSLN